MSVTTYRSITSLGVLNAATPGFAIMGKKTGRVRGTFVGTVSLEYSEDDGATWSQDYDKDGNALQWTAPARFLLEEWSAGVTYRLKMTAYTSGTASAGFID